MIRIALLQAGVKRSLRRIRRISAKPNSNEPMFQERKEDTMNEPIVIIEHEEPIPEIIKEWASAHSVPILKDLSESAGTDKLGHYRYKYVIEYSSDITIDCLEIAYCHAHDLPSEISSSERLIIKEIGPDNLIPYHKLIEEYPEAVSDKSLLGLSETEFKERHMSYIKYSYHFLGYGIWGIFLKNHSASALNQPLTEFSFSKEPVMIGIAGLDGTGTPALSYALFQEYQGKGYAFEACCQILEYVSNSLEMDSITIELSENNTASVKLAKKLKEAFPELICIKYS